MSFRYPDRNSRLKREGVKSDSTSVYLISFVHSIKPYVNHLFNQFQQLNGFELMSPSQTSAGRDHGSVERPKIASYCLRNSEDKWMSRPPLRNFENESAWSRPCPINFEDKSSSSRPHSVLTQPDSTNTFLALKASFRKCLFGDEPGRVPSQVHPTRPMVDPWSSPFSSFAIFDLTNQQSVCL